MIIIRRVIKTLNKEKFSTITKLFNIFYNDFVITWKQSMHYYIRYFIIFKDEWFHLFQNVFDFFFSFNVFSYVR